MVQLLMDMFEKASDMKRVIEDIQRQDCDNMHRSGGGGQNTVQTYDELVKDLIADEQNYLRELQMITRVSEREYCEVGATGQGYISRADLPGG